MFNLILARDKKNLFSTILATYLVALILYGFFWGPHPLMLLVTSGFLFEYYPWLTWGSYGMPGTELGSIVCKAIILNAVISPMTHLNFCIFKEKNKEKNQYSTTGNRLLFTMWYKIFILVMCITYYIYHVKGILYFIDFCKWI